MIILTRVDEVALIRALLEACPDLEIDGIGEGLPLLPEFRRLPTVGAMVRADREANKRKREQPGSEGQETDSPDRYFHLMRSYWFWPPQPDAAWAWEPPTLTAGTLAGIFRPNNPVEKAFFELILGVVRQVLTNRVRIEYPHLNQVLSEDGRSSCWVGHDAIRWCSEQPTRMLDGCLRPASDWVFPDLPWYRDIPDRERLGNPPP